MNRQLYQQLLGRYQSLPEGEQQILLVLAVICQPVIQTQLLELLKSLGGKGSHWRSLAGLVGKPWREKQLESGLLVREQNELSCAPMLLEYLSREAVDQGFYATIAEAAAEQWPPPRGRVYSHSQRADGRLLKRRLHHAFYQQHYDEVLQLLGIAPFTNLDLSASSALIDMCMQPLDEANLARLPEAVIFQVLAPQLAVGSIELTDQHELYALLERLVAEGTLKPQGGTALLLAEQRLYRGRLEGVEDLLESQQGPTGLALKAWLHCLRGDYDGALALYQDSLKQQRKLSGRRNVVVPGLAGVFHVLALLASQDKSQLVLARKQVQMAEKAALSDGFLWTLRLLGDVIEILQGSMKFTESQMLDRRFYRRMPPYLNLFRLMAHRWLGEEEDQDLSDLQGHVEAAQTAGLSWYAREGALLARLLGGADSASTETELAELEFVSITGLIEPLPAWQRSLQALQALVDGPDTDAAVVTKTARLVWWLDMGDDRNCLQPREQKQNKNGRWTKGRAVSLKRLLEEPENYDYLTEQDSEICRCIERVDTWGYYGGSSYGLNRQRALRAAVGHPSLYWASNPLRSVELVAAGPELEVQKKDRKLRIALYPFPETSDYDGREVSDCLLLQEGEHRVRLVEFSPQHLRIAQILGAKGVTVPLDAREQVLASINAIAPLLTVHSDIGGGQAGAKSVEADTRIHLHLQPVGEGLRLEWYVRPFAAEVENSGEGAVADGESRGDELGPMFRPGEGGVTVFAEIAGHKLQASRDLAREEDRAGELLSSCQLPALVGDGEYLVDDPEASLEMLLRLQESDQELVLAWPRGQKIRLTRESGPNQMQLSVKKQRDWFAVQGHLQLSADRVLDMQQLLALMQNSPGRFVRLGDGEVLALTRDLRQRLQALAAYGDDGRYNPLAAPLLDEALEGMEVAGSAAWKEQLGRLDSARQLEPALPTTLQAELRDYQAEGFRWLARLSHWGAGACLADDMGLGKTLQALALILARAGDGATLILAPTSVCMNWLDEALRFAPTLNVMRFGEGDRQAQLEQLAPFDVLVCSYGLLQHEAERLAALRWHTIVADEAQAIKNPATQRSRAAMALQGDFKMITTGTPIENHLGELWNLFRFINPGLLGSLDRFNQRFATPIETRGDSQARQQLRQLIRPFILRRLKSDVLQELPPRTEVTLHVELSEDEMVFYEAVRQQAMQRLSEAGESDNPGQHRVRILAEIMRLRRACCNPRLITPETTIGSSKLKAFGSVIQELRESHHKTLVFSQFVGHLEILREYLEQQGITYQYLDGSTPNRQRKKAVDAFQRGEGDVFLISLKAGGAGLNLTAADYVIHMDPWWNPAVEDQASDRAHRIGQQRPVTIYRMVAKNTIEEKIVGLHAQKRDLANSLLEGSELSGKMSLDEMFSMIRGE